MHNSPRLKKSLFIIAIVVFVYGSFLRLWRIGDAPYWIDEGFTITAVEAIAENGSPLLSSGHTYSCTVYCYITSAITDAFGKSAFSYRLLAALTGILLVLVLSAISYRLAGFYPFILTLIFSSLSYWQIAWSRQARWYTLISLGLWILIWLIIESRKRQISKIYWIILAISALVAVVTNIDQPIHLTYALPYLLSFIIREYSLFLVLAIFVTVNSLRNKSSSLYSSRVDILIILSPLLLSVLWLGFLTDTLNYRYLFPALPGLIIVGSIGVAKIFSTIDSSRAWRKYAFLILVVFVFFISSGILLPRVTYSLESDPAYLCTNRPYCAYTPQPDWNSAYGFIGKSMKSTDLVVSSAPQFTKIFLNTSGYWIQYSYTGRPIPETPVENDEEYYVSAKTIADASQLEELTNMAHKENTDIYIVIDSFARDNRISTDMLSYIDTHYDVIWEKTTDERTTIWVYRSK